MIVARSRDSVAGCGIFVRVEVAVPALMRTMI